MLASKQIIIIPFVRTCVSEYIVPRAAKPGIYSCSSLFPYKFKTFQFSFEWIDIFVPTRAEEADYYVTNATLEGVILSNPVIPNSNSSQFRMSTKLDLMTLSAYKDIPDEPFHNFGALKSDDIT